MKDVNATAVQFSMTPFVWHSDACVFVFKNGTANINRDNLVPGKPVKVVLLGDAPNEAQVESIRTIWRVLKDDFGFAVASFCNRIEPRINDIVTPAA